jgi:hypothetical protein
MARPIYSFVERVLIGTTGILLVLALIVGTSQNVLADPVLVPDIAIADCDSPAGSCASCSNCTNGGCGVGVAECVESCTATGGNCKDCNCEVKQAGTGCGCNK